MAEEPSKSVDPAWKGFPNFLHFAALFPFMPITIKNKNLQFKRFRLDWFGNTYGQTLAWDQMTMSYHGYPGWNNCDTQYNADNHQNSIKLLKLYYRLESLYLATC